MVDIGALTGSGGGGGGWNEYQAVNVPGSDGGGLGGGLGAMAADAALAVADTALANVPGASLVAGALGLFGSNLQPATLEVYEPPIDPAQPQVGGPVTTIEFRLNPHTITYTKSAQWSAGAPVKTQAAQTPQFGHAESAQMSFEVLFDTSFELDQGKANVVGPVNSLLACCVPTTASIDRDHPVPPWLRLHWGQATYPYMIMKSVNVTYPVFSADGIPLRATCRLSLQEVMVAKGGTNPTSGSRTAQGSHAVVAGDSLASIAYRHYGDAALWRRIAEANGIDDPTRLAVGSTLLVPGRADGRG